MSDEGMSDAALAKLRRRTYGDDGYAVDAIDVRALLARLDAAAARALAAERERDALRDALQRYGQCDYSCASNTILTSLPPKRPPCNCGYRAALTANHSAPVVEE